MLHTTLPDQLSDSVPHSPWQPLQRLSDFLLYLWTCVRGSLCSEALLSPLCVRRCNQSHCNPTVVTGACSTSCLMIRALCRRAVIVSACVITCCMHPYVVFCLSVDGLTLHTLVPLMGIDYCNITFQRLLFIQRISSLTNIHLFTQHYHIYISNL